MEIFTVPLDALVPDPENPRGHPTENITAIKNSLAGFGQVLPILVRDSDCQIVAGNGTVAAMQELGWKECQAVLYDGTDEECRALAVALNRTGELAIWNEENLSKIVGELRASGFDKMGSLGLSEQALDDLAGAFESLDGNGFQVEVTDLPEIPTGDKKLEQITFTLTGEQAEAVRAAVAEAMDREDLEGTGNPNKNGCALTAVCLEYLA